MQPSNCGDQIGQHICVHSVSHYVARTAVNQDDEVPVDKGAAQKHPSVVYNPRLLVFDEFLCCHARKGRVMTLMGWGNFLVKTGGCFFASDYDVDYDLFRK